MAVRPDSLRAKRQARTRAAVIDAAREEFDRYGFDGTNVRAIASRAALSTGAMFSSFAGKDDLFAEVYGDRAILLRMAEAMCLAAGSSWVIVDREIWIRAATEGLAIANGVVATAIARPLEAAA